MNLYPIFNDIADDIFDNFRCSLPIFSSCCFVVRAELRHKMPDVEGSHRSQQTSCFLEEAGIAEEVYAVAMERVSAWQDHQRVQSLLDDEETSE
jgi:hypothetical protein